MKRALRNCSSYLTWGGSFRLGTAIEIVRSSRLTEALKVEGDSSLVTTSYHCGSSFLFGFVLEDISLVRGVFYE